MDKCEWCGEPKTKRRFGIQWNHWCHPYSDKAMLYRQRLVYELIAKHHPPDSPMQAVARDGLVKSDAEILSEMGR